jgi:hypothetical protein
MKVPLAIVLVVMVLTAADPGAQFGGGRPPSGSYSRTCNNETMLGSVLTAECKNQNGNNIRTRLYVRTCVGDIANIMGELVCDGRRLPRGSYSQSCNACAAEGSALRCTCRDTKGVMIKTALDLASCEWGSDITNKDGHLQCD